MRRRIFRRWLLTSLILVITGTAFTIWWNQQQQPSGDFHYLADFTPSNGYAPVELQAGLLFTDYHTLALYGWDGKLKWLRNWVDPAPNEEAQDVWGDASQDGRTAAVVYADGDSLHVRAWQDGKETINCLVPGQFSGHLNIVVWHDRKVFLVEEAGKKVLLRMVDKDGIRAQGIIRPSHHFTVDNFYYCFHTNDDHRFICFWQHNQQDDSDLVSLSIVGDRILTQTQRISESKGDRIYEAAGRNSGATNYDMSDADWEPPYPTRLDNGWAAPSLWERHWAAHGRYAVLTVFRPDTHPNLFRKAVHPGVSVEYQLFERPGKLHARLHFSTFPGKPTVNKGGGSRPPICIRIGWHYHNVTESYLSPDGKKIILLSPLPRRDQYQCKFLVFSR